MIVNFKKLHKNANIPTKAHKEDAGFDLTAVERNIVEGNVVYSTGVSIIIPKGYVGYIFPRSSISNYDLQLCNSVAVIDAEFTGEIILKYKITVDPYNAFWDYKLGDKIGQLIIMPIPEIEFVEVDELKQTDRGVKGFGSSGE